MTIYTYNSQEEMDEAFEKEIERLEDVERMKEIIINTEYNLENAETEVNDLKEELIELNKELGKLRESNSF